MKTFTSQLRVRHYEMDALGHVNNAVYQSYLEQAAIEHSECLGLTLETLWVWVELASMRPKAVGQNILDLFTK